MKQFFGGPFIQRELRIFSLNLLEQVIIPVELHCAWGECLMQSGSESFACPVRCPKVCLCVFVYKIGPVVVCEFDLRLLILR